MQFFCYLCLKNEGQKSYRGTCSPGIKDPEVYSAPFLTDFADSGRPVVYPQIGKMQKPFTDQAIQYISPDMKCPGIQTKPRPSTKISGSRCFPGHLLHG